MPFIDPRYKERSAAERALVEVLELCWKYDPDERIDIFGALRMLEAAREEYEQAGLQ